MIVIGFDGQILGDITPPVPQFVPGRPADSSDVEEALVCLIATAIQPNLAGIPVKIYRGWPIPAPLDADLVAGIVNISVFPSEVEQKVTRHMPVWRELEAEAATLAMTVTGNVVTLSGAPGRYNCAVIVDNQSYVAASYSTDTLAAIASRLAALIPGATASGATLTVPGSHVTARAVGYGNAVRELKRQKKGYQITLWCGTPQARDAVSPLVDGALASVEYLPLPDGSDARLLYQRTRVSDRAESDHLYRRDLFYTAEYSTNQTVEAPRITTITSATESAGGTTNATI